MREHWDSNCIQRLLHLILVETEESRDRSMILCNLQGFVFADLKPNVFEWICQIPTAATQWCVDKMFQFSTSKCFSTWKCPKQVLQLLTWRFYPDFEDFTWVMKTTAALKQILAHTLSKMIGHSSLGLEYSKWHLDSIARFFISSVRNS